MAKDFLLVIGDREPLAWILTQERMAFPAHRAREAAEISAGDRLFLYTTRGCFHYPRGHLGRVIGEATAQSAPASLDKPVEFDEHKFPLGCGIKITGIVERGEGPVLAALVNEMHLFPSPKGWMTRLRRVLVALDTHDAQLLHQKLSGKTMPVESARSRYLEKTSFEDRAVLADNQPR